MRALIGNEFRKLRTIRSPWLLLATGPLLVLLGVAGVAVSGHPERPGSAAKAVGHAGLMSVLALIFGVLAVAGEYRHRTITDTYLGTPRRGRVVAAKLVSHTAVGAVFGVVVAAVAVVATIVAFAAEGDTVHLSDADLWRTAAGDVAWNAAFTAIGVALGALIRNVTAAISVALAWIALVEGLIAQLVGGVGRWLPFAGGEALGRMAGAGLPGPALSQWAGGLVLVCYAAVLAVAATSTSVRRDVT